MCQSSSVYKLKKGSLNVQNTIVGWPWMYLKRSSSIAVPIIRPALSKSGSFLRRQFQALCETGEKQDLRIV